MKITVAICGYNRKKYLERCMLSVLNQTYKDIEILYLDDASTDNSVEEVKRIITSHSNGYKVRIIEQKKNSKIGGNRNTAIDEATGDYLIFCDTGGYLVPNAVERIAKYAEETPVDCFAFSFERRIFETNEITGSIIYEDYCIENGEDFCVSKERWVNNRKTIVCEWAKAFKLSFLHDNNIHLLKHTYDCDIYFAHSIYLHAHSFRWLKDVLYHYLSHDAGSGSAFQTKAEASIPAANNMLETLTACYEDINQYRDRKEYTDLLIGLTGQTHLCARQLCNNPLVPKSVVREYLKKFFSLYPLSIWDILFKAKHCKRKHFFIWLLKLMPISLAIKTTKAV